VRIRGSFCSDFDDHGPQLQANLKYSRITLRPIQWQGRDEREPEVEVRDLRPGRAAVNGAKREAEEWRIVHCNATIQTDERR
jgi:hypothetical protein